VVDVLPAVWPEVTLDANGPTTKLFNINFAALYEAEQRLIE
jgi:hypothetical protein